MRAILSLLILSEVFFCFPILSFELPGIDRNLTLPKGVFEAKVQFDDYHLGGLQGKYGVTDVFQVSLNWSGFSTRGLVPDQKLNLSTHYGFNFGNVFSHQLALTLPVYFQSRVLQELELSFESHIRFLKNLELILFEEFINFAWATDPVVTFKFPIKLGWQVYDRLYLAVSTQLGAVDSQGFGTYFGDTLPFQLSALYSPTTEIDILGSFGLRDANKITQFSLMLGVVFRGGILENQ